MKTRELSELEVRLRGLCANILGGFYDNEAEVRSEFTRILRNYLERNPDMSGIKLREDRNIIDGRPDAQIGKFIIEFESPIKRNKIIKKISQEYIEKTKWYLNNLKEMGHTGRAVITNGIEMVFLDEEGEIVDRGFLCET